MKQVTNDFEAVAAEYAARFSFLGNVAVGRDVSVAELRERYAGVVLAYGAAVRLSVVSRDAQCTSSGSCYLEQLLVRA